MDLHSALNNIPKSLSIIPSRQDKPYSSNRFTLRTINFLICMYMYVYKKLTPARESLEKAFKRNSSISISFSLV